ncbi:hypothetical protein GCM10023115_19290 [Pontixanthobacter gangjinensis]|uniref:HNH endonuclease n=1 Tax=Pontixanthobacter gangjinensis TaxID=1028742 RepID=A0A6I4SP80_9SPHN|nr:HNH endonuclease [Pontixanthobacter gangjinensis]MXO57178.1 HNH endonuclease [Pontixanthobacter gangjinensis]
MSKIAWHKPGQGNRHQQGYGTAWDKLRKLVLERDKHLCQTCLPRPTVANHVDHILPKAKGGTDELPNLQALCADCHHEKTITDKGHKPRRKVRFGTDGWPIGS